MFGTVRLTFGQVLENLRKSLKSGRKSSEIATNAIIIACEQAHLIGAGYRHHYLYIRRRTLHISSKFSWQEILFLPLEHKIHILSHIFSPRCNNDLVYNSEISINMLYFVRNRITAFVTFYLLET